jgi:WD40 repeat protein
VSGSNDHTVRVWNAVSGTILHTLKGHRNDVRMVGFSSDGSRIVSGSDDYTARIWDADTGAPQLIFKGYRRHNHYNNRDDPPLPNRQRSSLLRKSRY